MDLPRVEALLLEIAAAHPRVLDKPQPSIKVRFAEHYVLVRVRPWIDPLDHELVLTDLHRMVTERFQQEGITIAIPARALHYQPEQAADYLPVPAETVSVGPQ